MNGVLIVTTTLASDAWVAFVVVLTLSGPNDTENNSKHIYKKNKKNQEIQVNSCHYCKFSIMTCGMIIIWLCHGIVSHMWVWYNEINLRRHSRNSIFKWIIEKLCQNHGKKWFAMYGLVEIQASWRKRLWIKKENTLDDGRHDCVIEIQIKQNMVTRGHTTQLYSSCFFELLWEQLEHINLVIFSSYFETTRTHKLNVREYA